jgi:hypothetical protein
MEPRTPARRSARRRTTTGEQVPAEIPAQGSSEDWSDLAGESPSSQAQEPSFDQVSEESDQDTQSSQEDSREGQGGWSESVSSNLLSSSSEGHSGDGQNENSNSDSSTSSSFTASKMSNAPITIEGETITTVATPNAVAAVVGPLYKKQDRMSLSSEKRAELLERAQRTCLSKDDKLELVTPVWDTDDVMEETLSLATKLERIQEHCRAYDFADVFNVVKLEPGADPAVDPPRVVSSMNLFSNWIELTPADVAKSNEWYRQYVDRAAHPWIPENLDIRYHFLSDCCDVALWNEIYETYKTYPASQQGGPLFLIILLKSVQKNNDTCLQNLVNRLRNLKVNEMEGENVGRLCMLTSGLIDRLQGASKYTTPDGVTHYAHIPDDFIKILLKMFQTTSVPDFNAIFAGLERDLMVYEGLEDPQLPDTLTVERILLLAKNTYDTMIGTGDWSGVKTQGTHSGFNVTCWNCDKTGHTASECKQPKHKDHIEQKRAEFRKSRGGRGRGRGGGRRGRGGGRGRGPQVPTTGKWAAPSHGEHQRRQIEHNGVTNWYKWNPAASRWIKEEPQGAMQAQAPGAGSSQSGGTVSTITTDATTATSTLSQGQGATGNVAAESIKAAAASAERAATKRSVEASMHQLNQSMQSLIASLPE